MGAKGIITSTAGLAILLQRGIGDTIRVSLTPEPGGDRTQEVQVAQQVLQSMGLRSFLPQVSACPGCGRTTSTFFQEMARDIQAYLVEQMPTWRETHPGRRGAARGGHGLRGERARASRSTPTSASRCPARSRSRWRRSSSTARRPRPCAATTSCPRFLAILEDYVDAPLPVAPASAVAMSPLSPEDSACRPRRGRGARRALTPRPARRRRRVGCGRGRRPPGRHRGARA